MVPTHIVQIGPQVRTYPNHDSAWCVIPAAITDITDGSNILQGGFSNIFCRKIWYVVVPSQVVIPSGFVVCVHWSKRPTRQVFTCTGPNADRDGRGPPGPSVGRLSVRQPTLHLSFRGEKNCLLNVVGLSCLHGVRHRTKNNF